MCGITKTIGLAAQKKAGKGGAASAAPGSTALDPKVAERNAARASSGGSYFSGAQFGQLTGAAPGLRISLFQKA